jgi:ADP-heptose:LPS heptosyltransferase
MMGIGDDIMYTPFFREAYEQHKKKVVPVRGNSIHWSPVYENNPIVTNQPTDDCIGVFCDPFLYSEGWFTDSKGEYAKLKNIYPKKGEIFLSEEEIELAKTLVPYDDYITIEPNSKQKWYSSNRDWGHYKWQQVVDAFPDLNFVQMYSGESELLENVFTIETKNIRNAFAILSRAKLHVGSEGGLCHAGTALGVHCIALFGGLSAPSVTGYPMNTNIYVEHPESPCGRRYECEHCKQCLEHITPDMLIKAIRNRI